MSSTEEGREHTYEYATSGSYAVTLTLTLNDGTQIQSQAYPFVGPGVRFNQGHTIYNSETWYSGGTYVVQGGITVAQGATLTIEPGTRVEANGGVLFSVSGTLKATGVTFTWADGQNQWYGIAFSGAGSSNSRLENCVIEHAIGYYYYSWHEIIHIENSSPTITGCTVSGMTNGIGIYVYSSL